MKIQAIDWIASKSCCEYVFYYLKLCNLMKCMMFSLSLRRKFQRFYSILHTLNWYKNRFSCPKWCPSMLGVANGPNGPNGGMFESYAMLHQKSECSGSSHNPIQPSKAERLPPTVQEKRFQSCGSISIAPSRFLDWEAPKDQKVFTAATDQPSLFLCMQWDYWWEDTFTSCLGTPCRGGEAIAGRTSPNSSRWYEIVLQRKSFTWSLQLIG